MDALSEHLFVTDTADRTSSASLTVRCGPHLRYVEKSLMAPRRINLMRSLVRKSK